MYGSAAQSSGGGGFWPCRGSWQAAAGAWAASSWRGADGAAPATRERARDVAAEVQTRAGITGLARLHTYRYSDDAGFPPILIFLCARAASFVVLLFLGSEYIYWCWLSGKRTATQRAARLRNLRDHQQEVAQLSETAARVDGSEPRAQITFPSTVWISPHGKKYHTSSSSFAMHLLIV